MLITIFVHVDFQTLLQPTRPALVSVRLVHRAASLKQSAGGQRPPGPVACGREAGAAGTGVEVGTDPATHRGAAGVGA